VPGTLFVVATPIGNLEDLTFRALRVLQTVDVIAAEDTRRTSKLLAHYRIQKRLVSIREHNERQQSAAVIGWLREGLSVAYVTDAGTPAISDPGWRLVDATRAAALPVVPIPGPSAVTAALSVSGVDASNFLFLGYPPSGGADRRRWWVRAKEAQTPVVFFEAPHRIERTLAEAREHLAERQIIFHKELSKINELSVIRPIYSPSLERGEFTVVVGPGSPPPLPQIDAQFVSSLVDFLAGQHKFELETAVAIAASAVGSDAGTIGKIIKKHKIFVKQQNKSSEP
jgi:16S rRNA (cytidine1402-2'-O)-methyltransferase